MSDDKRLRNIEEEVHEIRSEISEIKTELARYRGAVGAALVITTGLVALIKMVWSSIKDHVVWQ